LKVAALVPAGRPLELALAALHREGSLEARVHALLAAADDGAWARPERSPRFVAWAVTFSGLATAGAAAWAVAPEALLLVHRGLERLVHLF
jgi:hypothetical protein